MRQPEKSISLDFYCNLFDIEKQLRTSFKVL